MVFVLKTFTLLVYPLQGIDISSCLLIVSTMSTALNNQPGPSTNDLMTLEPAAVTSLVTTKLAMWPSEDEGAVSRRRMHMPEMFIERRRLHFENTAFVVPLNLPPRGSPAPEAILQYGNRLQSVATEEIQPGMVAHAVAYIETWNGSERGYSGTGAVIYGNIVVTAGHVLLSESGQSHVTAVRVTVGESVTSESRHGICIAFNGNWYATNSGVNDMAFIKLDCPFHTVQPLAYCQSPLISEGTIDTLAFGFPGKTDRSVSSGPLYKSKAPLTYNQNLKMFEHKGDTEKGSSGGPLIDASGQVIALHWGYCGINLAVTIDRNGNDFVPFLRILGVPILDATLPEQQRNISIELIGAQGADGVVYAWYKH
ncbi:trypsin-like cysteine/serine peptidase domain-containing protein [Hypoxylon trugodes]|uniref:trypsin-like cysteine/serine peptidase domain-containing protein n=1 Tax=Hypoxylon trugodes TaxID=326681 RepID=UPI002193C1D5|nr:trypsin-like cysteine/serine peptidase domain-containing protein [Hypoxylon trugodes]KAI1384100.1 trypsin-like cysteine/serine peptidase domain-containing protein [Hypoxylon trugodes]